MVQVQAQDPKDSKGVGTPVNDDYRRVFPRMPSSQNKKFTKSLFHCSSGSALSSSKPPLIIIVIHHQHIPLKAPPVHAHNNPDH